ncbi:MAG TPA: glycosyltransferase [Phycisphaerae bacterium]|nr:glycosyltransferase [Phycisphaerae bacterium]
MSDKDAASSPLKVLLVSAHIGAGHTQAARAVLEALRTAAPEIRAEHLNLLSVSPRFFRALYNGAYVLGMTRFPRIYGLGFRLANRPPRCGPGLLERVRVRHEAMWLRQLERAVLVRGPELILHTHFLGPPVVGELIARNRLAARQMVAVTDIEMHRWWYAEDVDRWFVPADTTAAVLRRWGVGAERITVSGIPIRSKWTAPLDRDRVLSAWRIPRDKKIVILTGGTEFTCGPVERIARGVLASCPEVCLVVLAGRNKKLLARMSRHPGAAEGRLVLVPFTDRAHELVEVCSLMVTKAGGVTTAECLAKGTAMVLLRPVPGQESGNAEYLAAQGAAVITRNADQAVAQVRRLLGDPAALEAMSAGARRLHRPAAQIIAESVLGAVCP